VDDVDPLVGAEREGEAGRKAPPADPETSSARRYAPTPLSTNDRMKTTL
jgi:hypothetical protein